MDVNSAIVTLRIWEPNGNKHMQGYSLNDFADRIVERKGWSRNKAIKCLESAEGCRYIKEFAYIMLEDLDNQIDYMIDNVLPGVNKRKIA